jgi:hypothetical protein
MKKSVYTFGILESSLVMLAVMPFLNNNSISNIAMAHGFDDYYSDDSSYSKYPTDNKKYECRTGPFEGFFVSSVEFCKHGKFDDKDRKDIRDNRTGTQGPQGPPGLNGTNGVNGTQGPQGPPGLNGTNGVNGTQGPSGITFINNTNLYEVPGPTVSVTSNFTEATSIATCDDGDIVIEGGYRSLNQGDSRIIVDGSSTANGDFDRAYVVSMLAGDTTFDYPKQFFAFAFCYDNPPPHRP